MAEKKKKKKSWQEWGKIRILMHCWQERKLVQPLWKTAWQLLKMLKIELAYDPAIPLLVIYSREMKTHVHTKIGMQVNIHISMTHNRQKAETAPMPILYHGIRSWTVKRSEVLIHDPKHR